MPEEQIGYTRFAHACILSTFGRFFAQHGWGDAPPMVLHGGAALHLFHGLQRRSSDMDFLVDRECLPMVQPAVERSLDALRQAFGYRGVEALVTASGKTKGDGEVTRYKIAINFPGLIGAVHVHLEFWPVQPDYVKQYPMRRSLVSVAGSDWYAEFRVPDVIGASADKVIAIVSRSHLKWRDIYDLWHLHTNCRGFTVVPQIMEAIPRQLECYEIMPTERMLEKIRAFLSIQSSDLVELAKTDLLSYLEQDERDLAMRLGWVGLEQAIRVARGYLTVLEAELEEALVMPVSGEAVDAKLVGFQASAHNR